MNRRILYIVLHCTATSQKAKVSSIVRYWKVNLKWNNPGYHFIIDALGNVTRLQPLEKPSNGVKGYNANSINISYIGGINSQGKAKDTRTPEQLIAMSALVKSLSGVFPKAKILGHRDFKGVKKDCPSFEVKEFIKSIGL